MDAMRRLGIFQSVCGQTPLEFAVAHGWTQIVEALFQEPELAGGMAEVRLRLNAVAKHLPHWPKDKAEKKGEKGEKGEKVEDGDDKMSRLKDKEEVNHEMEPTENPDGLDVLRRVVPSQLKPKDQEIIGDIPYNWLMLYEIKVMCLNAHSNNISSQRAMELVLASHGFDSFARNYSTNSILLSLIFFSFGLMVYVSFRLRAFGWLEVPISMAYLLPGAFAPERLADADFDPSRQKKQLPYRKVQYHVTSSNSRSRASFSDFFNHSFQAIFGIYTSWLLLCIRIPPEKDVTQGMLKTNVLENILL